MLTDPVSSGQFSRTIRVLLTSIAQDIGADACLFYQFEPDDSTLLLRGSVGVPSSQAVAARTQLSKTSVSQLAGMTSPRWFDREQPGTSPLFNFRELFTHYHTVFVVPLQSSNEFLGLLIAAFKLRPASDGRALRAIRGIVPSSIGLIAIFRRIHSFKELLS